MKALSIKQPWALLIAKGIKDVENRTWQTHFRGRIYIHAPATAHDVKFAMPNEVTAHEICISTHLNDAEENELFSCIIGEVDIVDCVLNHHSVWAEHSNGFPSSKKIYNWVLANPVLYETPILNVKGKLSFFNPEIPQ